jgi:hypothetical protein
VSNLLYLGIAVVLSVIGCCVLWLRNRRPRSMSAHMAEFARELQAIAPDPRAARGARADAPPPRKERSSG